MAPGTPARASDSVDEDRLWSRHMTVAKIGATPRGGVNRQALTLEDGHTRALIAGWAAELGFACRMDAMGNMFMRRPGTDPDAAPVMTGSHTDSQPSGGRFDGMSGVLTALEALQAAEEAGIATRRPLEAVVWTNEEGSRYLPGCMGSYVYAETDQLDRMLAIEDADGISVAAAVTDMKAVLPHMETCPVGGEVAAFVELHIEQGPLLEASGNLIGVVTGIQGTRRFEVVVEGEDAHAGTTPRARRKDAFSAAVAIVGGLEALMHDPEDIVRFTVGRFTVSPNAPSVVPGRVVFSIDFRHPQLAVLDSLGDRVEGVCQAHARGCVVTVKPVVRTSPIAFEGLVPETILGVAESLGLPHMHIFSGASHDAQHLFKICPTGMIFVPCERGISHSEIENAKPGDLAAGARVLADVIVELANR